MKAVYVHRDLPFRRIHTIVALIIGSPDQRVIGVPELSFLRRAAEGLDEVLMSSRYPDAVPALISPVQYYGEAQAKECIEWAQEVIYAVRSLLPNT